MGDGAEAEGRIYREGRPQRKPGGRPGLSWDVKDKCLRSGL